MSTELTTAAPQSLTTPTPNSGSLIAQTAASLGQAYQIAEALCQTQFAPQHFRGKPQEAAAAILYGSQVGLDPLASMQNIHVISGKPGMYARTMAAVIMAAGHRLWTVESTDDSVTVSGQRQGSESVETVTWTIERAKKAGYTSNKKYQTDPQAMLYARAASDVARRIAPDALLGMAYTLEELHVSQPAPSDGGVANLTPINPPTSPSADPEPVPESEEAATAPTVTTRQKSALNSQIKRLGLEADDYLNHAAEASGRIVEGTADLSEVEASNLLERLAALPDPSTATAETAKSAAEPTQPALDEGAES